MSKKIDINLPTGHDINRAIDALYLTSKDTILAIGGFAQVDKRQIKSLVDGIIAIQEKYDYIEDSNKLKDIDILTSLYLSAYPQVNIKDDKAFNRFYACYRNCKTYHYGNSGKKGGSSSTAKTIKREDVIAFLKALDSADYKALIEDVKKG